MSFHVIIVIILACLERRKRLFCSLQPHVGVTCVFSILAKLRLGRSVTIRFTETRGRILSANPTHDFPLGGSRLFRLSPSPPKLVAALVLSLALRRGPGHCSGGFLWGVLVPGHAGDAPTNRGRSCGHRQIFLKASLFPQDFVLSQSRVTISLRHLCSLLAEILVYFSSVNMPFRR